MRRPLANTRLIELDKLRNATDADCRMISNVRLFSEGIDIPALDGIVFFEARRAQIDIVQAVGRVMRKAKGKKLGYVVVPVVVPHGANVIDALKKQRRRVRPDRGGPMRFAVARSVVGGPDV